LKIEESAPISMKSLGNFIPEYIEREENFKIFLENNYDNNFFIFFFYKLNLD